eukprot:747177-Hanusia_phi.AAC.4
MRRSQAGPSWQVAACSDSMTRAARRRPPAARPRQPGSLGVMPSLIPGVRRSRAARGPVSPGGAAGSEARACDSYSDSESRFVRRDYY